MLSIHLGFELRYKKKWVVSVCVCALWIWDGILQLIYIQYYESQNIFFNKPKQIISFPLKLTVHQQSTVM